jgi:subtilisin family serine protease
MAAVGKGIGGRAGGRWQRRAAMAVAVGLAAVGILVNAQPAKATQDPYFSSQWNLVQIGAPAAWQRSTGAGVRIGIVDSGVDPWHDDLAGKVVAATNCINTSGDPNACVGSGQDDSGHGTHMAGIAAAAKDNGRGIAGVAPDAQLVVARVLSNDGGSIVDVEAGIRWVVSHGAHVVNLSLGDNPRAQAPLDLSFQAAIEEAWAAGAVPVVASGNPNALGPGKEDFGSLDALVVGATDARGAVTPYSNPLTTAKWGLVAPGGSGTGDGRDIISTWWEASAPGATNKYAFRAGASMAAAHASGVVALLLAQGLSRDAVVQRLVSTLRPMACGQGCRGRLDAASAVGATVAPAPLAGGASRAAPAGAPPQRSPAPPPSSAPAPPPAPSVPATTEAPPEPALTESGGEAAAVARGRALRAADAASTGGIAQSPGAVWAAIALMASAAIGLALRRPAWR